MISFLTLLAVSLTMTTQEEQTKTTQMLIDFDEPQIARNWITVNDNVMGGRSEGQPRFAEGILIFSGRTVTRGGGFSSIRTKPAEYNLSEADGLILRVRGDGRTYKADIQTDENRGRIPVAYRVDFPTQSGQDWQEIKIPFSRFIPTIFGEPIGRPGMLRSSRIRTLGFMIYDRKDGPFELEVDWIKAYLDQ